MAKQCDGNGGNHCCYLAGKQCELLTHIDGVPRCSLMLEHGDWSKVHADPRYIAAGLPEFYERRWPGMGYGCGDWPQNIPNCRGGLCCFEV